MAMDLKKLPPSVLLALGLASCDDTGSTTSGDSTVGPCLSPAESSATLGPCLDVDPTIGMTTSGSTGGSDSGTTGSTGMTEGDVSTGPCLTPEPPDSSGSDTDTGTGTDGTSSGGMEAPPSDSRAEALRRVLDRGALPADVAARLAATAEED